MNPSKHKGFTLLEVLVAFAIMAMSVGIIYRAMGSSASVVAKVSLQQKAIVLAESLLDSRDWVPQQGWNESGISAGMEWKATSTPYQPATPLRGTVSPNAVALHKVGIAVHWHDADRTQSLEIYTLLPEGRPLPGETIK